MSIKLVAEIGCNHKGDFTLAKELVDICATYIKADIIKFQKRTPKELLSAEEYNAPHPNPIHSYGKTYGEHREKLEFTIEQHAELKSLIESHGKVYSTSVWDLTSTKEVIALKPQLIKVPSAKNTNKVILKELVNNYDGEIHISLGMTTVQEEEEIMKTIEPAKDRVVIYYCCSAYPCSFEDLSLLDICRLKEKYKNKVKNVSFSGHHLGIAIDMAAATLMGCDGYIERHVTGFGGRVWKGTDHGASLEPDGFRKLVRDIKALEISFKHKDKEIVDAEIEQRIKLGKGK